MCRLLGVSTSGYYPWVDRGPSTRDEANARLLETINGIHQQSRRTHGTPRITAELREDGLLVGKNQVARLGSNGRRWGGLSLGTHTPAGRAGWLARFPFPKTTSRHVCSAKAPGFPRDFAAC